MPVTPYDGARLRGVVMATMLGGEIVFDHGECIGPADRAAPFRRPRRSMSAITTHVLDTAHGRPAAGIGVALERRADDGRVGPRRPRPHRQRRPPADLVSRERAAAAGRVSPDVRHAELFRRRSTSRRSIRKWSSSSRRRRAKRTTTCRCCSARSATRTYRGTLRPRCACLRRDRSSRRSAFEVLTRGERPTARARSIRASRSDGSRFTPSSAARDLFTSDTAQRRSARRRSRRSTSTRRRRRRSREILGLRADSQVFAEAVRTRVSTSSNASRSRTSVSTSRTATARARRGRGRPRGIGGAAGRRRAWQPARCRRSSASASSRCRGSCTPAACARSTCSSPLCVKAGERRLPDNFAVTIPKVMTPAHVSVLARACAALERKLQAEAHSHSGSN